MSALDPHQPAAPVVRGEVVGPAATDGRRSGGADGLGDTDLIAALPGLMRLVATAGMRTARWGVGAYIGAGGRLLHAASSPSEAAELVDDLRTAARSWLGIDDDPDATERRRMAERGGVSGGGAAHPPGSLRERGAELLRQSADVRHEEDVHPAYGRILGELAPDEARILRFLAEQGPQPSVDVRSSRTLGVSSELVAPGLSMIGAQAGVRFADRVHAYLNNLHRLGLLWFSRETLTDPLSYQVLEAQPEVLEAMQRGSGRGRTVRRTIHLTPFGDDFCRQCLPLGLSDGEHGQMLHGPPNGGPHPQAKEIDHG